MRMFRHALKRVCRHAWIRIIRMILMCILSMNTPWNILFRGPWVVNIYSTMVTCIKLAGGRPMSTSVITITVKT